MLDIHCLASGSSGNCYLIDDGVGALLLEAGINHRKIFTDPIVMQAIPRLEGCLVSHEHGDHAKGVAGVMERGVDVYTTAGTWQALKGITREHRRKEVRAGRQFKVGASWIILPFQTKHDANEPVGFLLYSTIAQEKLLFATDTYYIPNTFCRINTIMVECNYSLELLDQSIDDGKVPPELRGRLLHSHFSLENVCSFLQSNDLSQVRRIFLIHVSDNNGDKFLFKSQIERLTGIPVTVC